MLSYSDEEACDAETRETFDFILDEEEDNEATCASEYEEYDDDFDEDGEVVDYK
jgi:hypothetical protein